MDETFQLRENIVTLNLKINQIHSAYKRYALNKSNRKIEIKNVENDIA